MTKIPYLSHHTPTLGLIFIGDPHIWSHKPGRRRDESFLDTIIGKMNWIAQYCNENNLWPVILGDLLHEATDNNLLMISKLVEALKLFDRKPLVLVGNHDLNQRTLVPGTVLHLLQSTHQIHAMMHNGPFCFLSIEHASGSKNILIGGTPYGVAVPKSLSGWTSTGRNADHHAIKKSLRADEVVWITHDDFAFDHSYPNAIPIEPIVGVDYAINGHMHTTQKPILKGQTAWYNPGNISRLTIDLIDQIPKIWKWTPQQETMEVGADGLDVPMIEGVEIPHIKGQDILSLEGRVALTAPSSEDMITAIAEETTISRFVEQIKEEQQINRSDDGVFLAQSIQEELEQSAPPAHVQSIINHLFEQALIKHREQL